MYTDNAMCHLLNLTFEIRSRLCLEKVNNTLKNACVFSLFIDLPLNPKYLKAKIVQEPKQLKSLMTSIECNCNQLTGVCQIHFGLAIVMWMLLVYDMLAVYSIENT